MVPLKVYKSNNKYIVYLPFDVIKQLGIKDDEEVDFVKFREGAFLFAKKADIPRLAASASASAAPQALRPPGRARRRGSTSPRRR